MSEAKKHRQLKKGIDADDARGRRRDQQVELRKSKKIEQIAKRRHAVASKHNNGGQEINIEAALIELPKWVAMCKSNNPQEQYQAVSEIRRLLSVEKNPPIQQVVDTDVVPVLIEILKNDRMPPLQFEAAWAVTNIASGTSQHTRYVVEKGAIPVFVHLLTSPNDEVREQAVWALGNIAGDSHLSRDQVLATNCLKNVLGLCNFNVNPITTVRNATWTVSNLCRGKPHPAFEKVKLAVQVLAHLIKYCKDEDVLTDAAWAMSYISDDTDPNNERIQEVIQSDVVRYLVLLLQHPSPNIKTPALRTIGNIVTGDDLQTQTVLESGALEMLVKLLNHERKGIVKEACWTISNITAGRAEQIELVIRADIIPQLITVLKTADFEIKKEAAWALSNATSDGTPEQIRYLVEQGLIPPLCELFEAMDVKVVLVALEGIENILNVGKKPGQQTSIYSDYVEKCGGLAKLDKLQRNGNNEVYKKAVDIITKYFVTEDDDEDNGASFVDQGEYSFGGGNTGGNTGFEY